MVLYKEKGASLHAGFQVELRLVRPAGDGIAHRFVAVGVAGIHVGREGLVLRGVEGNRRVAVVGGDHGGGVDERRPVVGPI